MARLVRKRPRKAGLPPGTIVPHEAREEKPRITIIDYDAEHLEEREVERVEECFPFRETPSVTWVNIDGVHDVELLTKLGDRFGIHPLVLEDLASTGQRPKLEVFDNLLFIVLRMLSVDGGGELDGEQVSLLVGENFIISFQERPGDVFEPVRDRLRTSRGRIRRVGPDYLAYALIDIIVDNYFTILEVAGDRIEDLDEAMVEEPSMHELATIRTLKKEMIFLRKSIWPLREVVSGLERSESPLVHESTVVYLRDVYDHTVQVIDTVESLRDMTAGLLDLYLSSVSNRMNEVMKVLTIIATIFIPLTFIAGIYGMNFERMPELKLAWGYPAALGAMLVVGVVMIVYFRRRHWL
ncbi:MAG: magnesium/cobalt transporter CorA [Candidatus Krumholzibacteriota bacterium]|nr:magnesium/cobalt transporter CorA [Candidatus Krumholzibacteriota bacterium]